MGPSRGGISSAVYELVEAGVVDDAGVLDLFGHRAGADRSEPVGQRRASTSRDDGEVSRDRTVARQHASDDRRVAVRDRLGHNTLDPDAVQDRAVRAREHRSPQDPLERRTPARQHDELVVTWSGCPVGHLRGQVLCHPQLGRARGEQISEHIGIRGAQQAVEPGEECMAVADLRRAPAIPVEGRARIGREGSGVALEQRHPVPVPAQRQGRPQAGHAGAHHHDPRAVIRHGGESTGREREFWHQRQVAGRAAPWFAVSTHDLRVLTSRSGQSSATEHPTASQRRDTTWPRSSLSTSTLVGAWKRA